MKSKLLNTHQACCMRFIHIADSAGSTPPSSRNRPDLSALGDIANKIGDSSVASDAQNGIEGMMQDMAGGKLATMAQQLIQGFNSYVKAIADDSAEEALERFKRQANNHQAPPISAMGTPSSGSVNLGETYFTGKCTGCPASWYQKCNDGDKMLGKYQRVRTKMICSDLQHFCRR